MKPVSTFYDEYIDRPKLTEQKNPFKYIVPSPSRGVGTKILLKQKNGDHWNSMEDKKKDNKTSLPYLITSFIITLYHC